MSNRYDVVLDASSQLIQDTDDSLIKDGKVPDRPLSILRLHNGRLGTSLNCLMDDK